MSLRRAEAPRPAKGKGSNVSRGGTGSTGCRDIPLGVSEEYGDVRRTGLKTCPYVCSVSFSVGITCPQVTRCIHDRAAVTRRRVTGTEALNKLKSWNQAPFFFGTSTFLRFHHIIWHVGMGTSSCGNSHSTFWLCRKLPMGYLLELGDVRY